MQPNLDVLPRVQVICFAPPTKRYAEPGTESWGPFLDDGPQVEPAKKNSIFFGKKKKDNTPTIGGLNDQGDISKRLDYLIKMINEANLELGAFPSNTIRLFVAPEWYFRRKDRPYTLQEVTTMLQLLLEKSRSLKSWLIAPGTVFWGEQAGDNWTVYNMAPVVFEGSLLSVIHKQYEADISNDPEQKRTQTWGIPESNGLPATVRASNKVIQALGKSPSDSLSSGFFSCKNLRFALDICRDHAGNERRLKKTIESIANEKISERKISLSSTSAIDKNTEEQVCLDYNAAFVHIHILLSCGAEPLKKSNVAGRGGFLIQCDGSAGSPQETLSVASVINIPNVKYWKFTTTVLPTEFAQRAKRISPANSSNPFSRLFIFDELLDLNPAPIHTSLTATSSNAK